MRLVSVPRAALLAAALSPALAAPAEGAPGDAVTRIDAPSVRTLAAPAAERRDCTAAPAEGRRGVVVTTWTAPADGIVTVGLRAASGDWDLALFDARGRGLVASSAGFGAQELAQTGVRRGARLLVQACRRTGSAATALVRTQVARVDTTGAKPLRGRIQLVRVALASQAAFAALQATGLDVTEDNGPGYANVVLYGTADRARLLRAGFGFRVVIADMVARERRARAAERVYTARVGVSPLPSGRTTYRTYEDYQRELKDLVERYPDLVRPVTLKNRSFQGREIQAVEIAQDVKDGDDGRPVFTLGTLHHAREWPAAESAMEFAWDLVKNGATDARLARVLREVRVVIMPLTNPDGFLLSRNSPEVDPDDGDAGAYSTTTGVVLFGGSFAYKRKNCNPVYSDDPATPCEVALGVDPNRNYATDWGGPGASTNPHDQGYRGAAPFSEPEPRAVQELSSMFNSPVHVSTHTVAAKVLRPPGLEADGLAPDEAGLKALGKAMADPTGYANEYGWQLYDTTGTTKDWGYDALGQYAYTVEMGPSNGTFHGEYKVHVIDQYQGPATGRLRGRGLREAYANAALFTRNQTETSRLTGSAPAGATLRIRKAFTTETYPVCLLADPLPVGLDTSPNPQYCTGPGEVQQVPEKLEFSMEVPASGAFTWWVNPSTRPFVLRDEQRVETYTLTCEVGGQVRQTVDVLVARGETKQLDLSACAA